MINKAQMQAALNGLAKAHNQARRFRSVVSEYSQQEFGCDPSDVDNDEFIDQNDGGCGECTPMTVDEFRGSMFKRVQGNKSHGCPFCSYLAHCVCD